ncbi:MAG TPA: c-type cytochrome [Gammaproteobacteria bacterium]|nr:c-type cytochrome [Gammaproteobacteria bacterium]
MLPVPVQAFDYPAPGDFAQGAKEWADNCGRCHNIRGAKELRDDQWITTMFHMRLRAGLTGQEMRNILTFLQGSNNPSTGVIVKTSTATGSATSGLSGKDIYSQTCIACHGADGKGVLPGVPDFTRKDGRLSKPDATLLKHVTEGFQSPGSPMAMPPKGGNSSLTEGDLKNVIEYLHQEFGS